MAAGAAWEDLTASERASLAFMFLENAAGAPAAFKFLGKLREGLRVLSASSARSTNATVNSTANFPNNLQHSAFQEKLTSSHIGQPWHCVRSKFLAYSRASKTEAWEFEPWCNKS